jgi:hypothetical protein
MSGCGLRLPTGREHRRVDSRRQPLLLEHRLDQPAGHGRVGDDRGLEPARAERVEQRVGLREEQHLALPQARLRVEPYVLLRELRTEVAEAAREHREVVEIFLRVRGEQLVEVLAEPCPDRFRFDRGAAIERCQPGLRAGEHELVRGLALVGHQRVAPVEEHRLDHAACSTVGRADRRR